MILFPQPNIPWKRHKPGAIKRSLISNKCRVSETYNYKFLLQLNLDLKIEIISGMSHFNGLLPKIIIRWL